MKRIEREGIARVGIFVHNDKKYVISSTSLALYSIHWKYPQVKMFLVVALAYIIFWGPLFTVSLYDLSINVEILTLILIFNLLGTTVHGEFLWAQDLNPGQRIRWVQENWALF